MIWYDDLIWFDLICFDNFTFSGTMCFIFETVKFAQDNLKEKH